MIQTQADITLQSITSFLQPLILASIPVIGAVLISKQAALKKQNEEIHVAVNSKSDAYIKEIAELKATIREKDNAPGVVAELKGIIAMLQEQNSMAAHDKRDAQLDTRLAGIEAAARAPSAPPLSALANDALPGSIPVTVVKQVEPLPVKVIPDEDEGI